ncbi:asparagine synthase (glutamine-hydrolyzing) [Poritiphilus flavus]|uniref:asparagine synthase (glutamine-hydrolyzing) n=1 Tax=Poritiphilus flavus TaxID=2697053 RepID=A0A6L9EAP3_9FLAO|nr:asparagine synthase (glutamine-hydrolyzing) [Poritiphilus flavus]NAS11519.1 asparagine synthase (glutamine-hydrolyzing) [Poritiphilus flavus]
MCGIFGVLNFGKRSQVDLNKLKQGIELQRHRGPNFRKAQLVDDYLGLAHTRLSILDLSDCANQPFEKLGLYLVFNGEVFNYVELREELSENGYNFSTRSDTEVVITAYHFWGEDCVSHFNGMWAFAIYDPEKDVLFCSRDRFGIKPFYYVEYEGDFLFSSEIKSILHYYPSLKRPNYNAISAFCRESAGGENVETWFKDIFRLPPAHSLSIKEGKIDLIRYWDFPTSVDKTKDYESFYSEYKSLFQDAIRIRLRSDVPLGATMSSGLDSTSIVSTVDKNFDQRIKAYTASFPEEIYDEFQIVSELLNCFCFEPNQVLIEYDSFLCDMNKLIYHLESGHASPAIFPLSKINAEATKKLTVILEGQGADELLAGYLDSVFIDYLLDLFKSLRFKKIYKEIKLFKKNWSLKTAVLLFGRNHMPEFLKKMYRKKQGTEAVFSGHLKKYSSESTKVPKIKAVAGETRLHRILRKQHKSELVNLLFYGDAVSMMHSLESRLPFMDYRLVELVFKMPNCYLINEGYGKFIHRKIAEEVLPRSVTHERSKNGFRSPVERAFKEDQEVEDILLGDALEARNIFDKKVLKDLLTKTRNEEQDYSRVLFRILSVELWFRTFIDQ